MKIAITGHTKGIGKAIADVFSDQGYEVIGLSRSNGYDIKDTQKIVDASKDCDVFINNAYHEFEQEKILKTMNIQWKGTDKVIISIGSIVTDYPRIERQLDNQDWPYRNHKRALRDSFRRMIGFPMSCRLVLISPGATDTDMIKQHDCVKMAPLEVANVVRYALENKFIKELMIYA